MHHKGLKGLLKPPKGTKKGTKGQNERKTLQNSPKNQLEEFGRKALGPLTNKENSVIIVPVERP